jgi:hypothetical protein
MVPSAYHIANLYPPDLSEVVEQGARNGNHECNGGGVAVSPAKFRHVFKVHAVYAGDYLRRRFTISSHGYICAMI